MDRHHDQTRSGSPASLEPSLVTILLAMERKLGSLEEADRSNAHQIVMIRDHMAIRFEDLRNELFARLKRTDTRTDTDIDWLDRRVRRTEQSKSRSIGSMVWGFVKLIPIKHTILIVGIWMLALFGILSPAEMAAAIKDLFLPAIR